MPGGRRYRPRRVNAIIGEPGGRSHLRAWLAWLATLRHGGGTSALHSGPVTSAIVRPHFSFRVAGPVFGFSGTTVMVATCQCPGPRGQSRPGPKAVDSSRHEQAG